MCFGLYPYFLYMKSIHTSRLDFTILAIIHTLQIIIYTLYIILHTKDSRVKNGNSVTTLWLTCFDDLFHFLGSFNEHLAPRSLPKVFATVKN